MRLLQAAEEHKSPRWMIVRTITLLVVINCLHTMASNKRFVRDMMAMTSIGAEARSSSDDVEAVINTQDGNHVPRPNPLTAISNAVLQAHATLNFTHYPQAPPHLHPFAGALDEHQNWGYIHDAQVLRKQQHASIQLDQKERQEVCLSESTIAANPNLTSYINTDGHKVLDKIQVHNHTTTTTTNKPRILCAIYTYEGHKANIEAIAQTWGQRCDGFLAASTYTDASTGTVHLPHFGKEGTYNSIWQKVRSLLAYLYSHYSQHYDYFHISGDDTYVIVENLRQYLGQDPIVVNATKHHQPVYAGGWIRPFWRPEGRRDGLIYNGGGPGYTLNTAALELLVTQGLALCNPNIDKSEEDLFMGLCLKQIGSMAKPTDTTDSQGAARYHHLDPSNLLEPQNGQLKRFTNRQKQWRIQELGEPKDALEAVSPSSVAFHLIKHPTHMRRMDALLYPSGRMARSCHQSS